MNNRRLLLGALVVIAVIAVAVWAYDFVLGEPEAASQPIAAIPLAPNPTPTDQPTSPPTSQPTSPPTSQPTDQPTSQPTDQPTSQPTLFEILPAESQVRFILDEDLRGVRTTVVGATDQVAGQLALDLADPGATQVGIIQVNARTLLTDNNFRNNAIRNRILNTDQFEFITFTPTEVRGLPASAAIGDPVSFEIEGDLTIRDITNPVAFTVTATPVTTDRLEGQASATVDRADYNLVIPQVDGVANVDEAVRLEIDFVALAVVP